MKNIIFIIGSIFCIISASFAAEAKQNEIEPNPYLFVTAAPAPFEAVEGRIAVAYYHIQNISDVDLPNNSMQPIQGIRQIVEPAGYYCDLTFNLYAGSSCLLALEIATDQLKGPVTGGPTICASKYGEPSTDCYSAPYYEALNITPVPEATANMPTLESNRADEIVLEPNVPTVITITHTSKTSNVNNAVPVMSDELSEQLSNVTLIGCISIAPIGRCVSGSLGFCTMIFTAKADAVELDQQTIKIQGANTKNILELPARISTKTDNQKLITQEIIQ
jgi:hypothetical protein